MAHAAQETEVVMPQVLGAHSPRIELARELLKKKGRRATGLFSFEGPTLLEEAIRSGVAIASIFATKAAYDRSETVHALDAAGVPVYIVDTRAFARISDLETPSGLLAVAPVQIDILSDLLADAGVVLVLADLNDPGNAGTLLRSAEAFGVRRAIFGSMGVEPRHPKVVRGAMGASFRLLVGVATPEELESAASAHGWHAIGLTVGGEPLDAAAFPERCLLIVGHERSGLGLWERVCHSRRSIPMTAQAESLNAAVAGSIAMYEAAKRA
ncbi:MAG: RNA methyltransferase [Candidatus Baltobacteraceae bacterium]